MDDIAADLSELIFSLFISYVGALEFFFVLRQLCHFSGHHPACSQADEESLQELKEKLRRKLAEFAEKEKQSGAKSMQDGVLYKDGFRIDPDQAEIDSLKEKINAKDIKDKRRAEIEAELARQRQIEEETRKQLEQAEAELARQRAKAAEEEESNKQKQQQERQHASEEAENFRKLLEAEKQREIEQRKLEAEAEAKAEEELRQKEEKENSQKLLEEEKKRESEQRKLEENEEEERKRSNEMRRKALEEEAESEKNVLAAEKAYEDKQRQHEEYGTSEKFPEVDKLHEDKQSDDLKLQMQNKFQSERDRKQQVIEENARKFLEAEQEMVQLQQKMLESVQYGSQVPVVEEPIIKRTHMHAETSAVPNDQLMQTVKTQFSQRSNESFTLSSKPLLFPSISDDASSNEPPSSKQSSFSTHPSEEMTTGNEEASRTTIGLQLPQHERQEPDGEDNAPSVQYTEDYLRSLDGLKVRPLTREDGSGRRRAFKKRRSSGSSNSSRESRTSRDEELKMFTSLEEEELKNTHKGDDDFTPIKYSNEPSLKVKGHHHRRHKRSPAKDTKVVDDSLRTSLEMLGEEGSNPWGEVVPEHYKDTEFWRREKAMSIDEEEIELESTARSGEARTESAVNKPNSSSFEEATIQQNQEAISTLKKQLSKDPVEQEVSPESNVETSAGNQANKNKDANPQSSQEAEGTASPSRASASPRLRRSPRIDEMDQYEERWRELEKPVEAVLENLRQLNSPTTPTTPTIAVHSADDVSSWRDEHGLIMQGLSDFYDFTASVNPSRSRSTSRNPSPASSKPNSPLPESMTFRFDGRKLREELDSSNASSPNASNVYDKTGNFVDVETKNIAGSSINSFHDEHIALNPVESHINAVLNVQELTGECKNSITNENIIPAIFVESNETNDIIDETRFSNKEMNDLVESIRKSQQKSKSPTPINIEHSLEVRRSKLVRQNDEIFESALDKSPNEDDSNDKSPLTGHNREKHAGGNIKKENVLKPDECHFVDRRRSRSRSPLPTSNNIERSLEMRRNKLIQHNDEFFEKLTDDLDIKSESPPTMTDGHPQNVLKPVDRKRSRSRSPLPTTNNLEKSLEIRRNKLIQHNDELFEKLTDDLKSRSESPLGEDPQNVLKPDDCNFVDRRRSRSRSPLPTSDNIERSLRMRRDKLIQHNDEFFEKLTDDLDIKSESSLTMTDGHPQNVLKPDECQFVNKRRSRSRSPLSMRDNTERSVEMRQNTLVQQNDEFFEKLTDDLEIRSKSPLIITVEHAEEDLVDDKLSRDDVLSLVSSLRISRTRSRSKSPMRIPNAANLNESISNRRDKLIERNDQLEEQLEKCALSPETPRLIVEYVYEIEEAAEDPQDCGACSKDAFIITEHISRSRTPSRSHSPNCGTIDFHRLPNLESSQNQTHTKGAVKTESILTEKQRYLDEEALQKLKTANEETELRILTPSNLYRGVETSEGEEKDMLPDLPAKERLQKSPSSPTTPDYDRTISEEWRDFQRVKNEMLSSGFKRSRYVGESMELGSENEQLRREAATFRRSRSPSPSIEEQKLGNSVGKTRQTAAERRHIQDDILKQLILSSSDRTRTENSKHGAKPKIECALSDEYSRSLSKEIQDTERIRNDLINSGFQRSTFVDESVDDSESYEDMRREMAEFRRSRSCSRSPVDERNNEELVAIEIEAARRELQDQIIDRLSTGPVSFQDFSHLSHFSHLNANFLDDRRASDSAVIHKSDMSTKLGDNTHDNDIEPEEYHHYRRFSLNQEQQIEEYPNDEFIYISEIEVRSLDEARSWIQEDNYSASVDNLEVSQKGEESVEIAHEEEETEDSEDERQTVVEVDDEIDTDICDFNERGPTDESHHEQSECEEAERAMDHYANREATDWQRVSDLGEIFNANDIQAEEEGAVGGVDSDSFEIDQIYDEAIKNRKQSGILREYDSILLEMQKNLEHSPDYVDGKEDESNDQERYALWSKTRTLERGGGRKLSVTFAETEKHDTELRYLGDANMTARQLTRLRSRYGYAPQLKGSSMDDEEVDVNYKPKREYNWRKNFKLDDEEQAYNDMNHEDDSLNEDNEDNEDKETFQEFEDLDDIRKYSLGGESITLYSRSPDREIVDEMNEADNIKSKIREASAEDILAENIVENKEIAPLVVEKPKKKKSKKKAHRESKESIENRFQDEDDSDNQIFSRRSSIRQLETDSPKRKSRSRRGSKSSITNDDTSVLFSPRNSLAPGDSTVDNILPSDVNEPTKKKVKKRKKAKDVFDAPQNIKEEQEQPEEEVILKEIHLKSLHNGAISVPTTNLLESANPPELSHELRPQKGTSASTTSTDSVRLTQNSPKNDLTPTTATTTVTTPTTTTVTTERSTARTTSSSVDSFDILKDANFYPLF